MTYGRLKDAIKVLLIGDNEIPTGGELVAALEMAYIEISNKTTALKLLTVNKDNAIMRMGPGDTYIRMPALPRDDTDELDLDNELVPAVARIIASYVSDKKGSIHMGIAFRMAMEYENKVQVYLEELARREDAKNVG